MNRYEFLCPFRLVKLLRWYHVGISKPLFGLASLSGTAQIGLVLLCVTSPKVAEASTVSINEIVPKKEVIIPSLTFADQ
jgi:hypothetical protein